MQGLYKINRNIQTYHWSCLCSVLYWSLYVYNSSLEMSPHVHWLLVLLGEMRSTTVLKKKRLETHVTHNIEKNIKPHLILKTLCLLPEYNGNKTNFRRLSKKRLLSSWGVGSFKQVIQSFRGFSYRINTLYILSCLYADRADLVCRVIKGVVFVVDVLKW